jgi:hypothetical protein
MIGGKSIKIAVCIKQVPDTTKVKIDEKTGTLIRSGVESKTNPSVIPDFPVIMYAAVKKRSLTERE